MTRTGFVGAGNIGQRLAHLATSAAHHVTLSNSRGPESLRDVAADLGARAATVDEAGSESDIVVVTVPLNRLTQIDPAPFDGRVVIDTCNYYPARDGRIIALDERRTTTSQLVQEHFSDAFVVKGFNAIMASDLIAAFGLPAAPRALPIAGDDHHAVEVAAELHRSIGFDVVPAGGLEESWQFERAKPAYCIPLDRERLIDALAAAERTVELPHNSWKRDEN